MRNLVGNWIFSGTYTAESPQYATVQSGLDSNMNVDSAPDRAIVNPGGVDRTGSDVEALTNSAGQTVGYLALESQRPLHQGRAGRLCQRRTADAAAARHQQLRPRADQEIRDHREQGLRVPRLVLQRVQPRRSTSRESEHRGGDRFQIDPQQPDSGQRTVQRPDPGLQQPPAEHPPGREIRLLRPGCR